MEILTDSMFLMYGWIFIVLIYLFSLFLSEWIRLRGATVVFAFNAMLFGALAIQIGGTVYMRVLYFVDPIQRDIELIAFWWTARCFLTALILTIVAIYFTRRTIQRRRGEIPNSQ